MTVSSLRPIPVQLPSWLSRLSDRYQSSYPRDCPVSPTDTSPVTFVTVSSLWPIPVQLPSWLSRLSDRYQSIYPHDCLVSPTDTSPVPHSFFLTSPFSYTAMELRNVAISKLHWTLKHITLFHYVACINNDVMGALWERNKQWTVWHCLHRTRNVSMLRI